MVLGNYQRLKQLSYFSFVVSIVVLVGCSNSKLDLPLTIDSAELEVRWATGVVQRTVRLENKSNSPIEIENISSGCTCTEIQPTSFTIGPRETASIHVTIDLMHNATPNLTIRVIDIPLVMIEKDGRKKNFALRGNVQDVFIGLRQNVVCEPIDLENPVVAVFLKPTIPLNAIRVDSPYCSATTTPIEGEAFRLELRLHDFSSLVDREQVKIPLSLTPLGESIDSDVRVGINLIGRIKRNVSLSQHEVSMGTVNAGEIAEETITISTIADGRFLASIEDEDQSNSSFRAELEDLGESKKMRLKVAFVNNRPGKYVKTFNIMVREDSSHYELPVEVIARVQER